MKIQWLTFLGGLFAVGIFPRPALAQESQPTTPTLDKRPVVIAPDTKAKKDLPAPANKGGGQNSAPPETIKALVNDFQAARQAYLAQQKELRRQLQQATEEQRQAIREKLRENLQAWLEVQRARTEELREQAQRIKEQVKDLQRVVDSAGEKGRGR